MAKELMEIGGFITSGAEIVNHDASLSGNGTVDSPLGLSNETVLWSGARSSACTLSESFKNFEWLRIVPSTPENGPAHDFYVDDIGKQTNYLNMSIQAGDVNAYDIHVKISANADGTQLQTVSSRAMYGSYTSTAINVRLNNANDMGFASKVVGINRIGG